MQVERGAVQVFYHNKCLDGAWAAAVVRRALMKTNTVIALTGISAGTDGKDILDSLSIGVNAVFVDITPPASVIQTVNKIAKNVYILDHHITQQPEFNAAIGGGFAEGVFDINRSGAGLAIRELMPDCPIRRVVEYIEDRDLWKFSMRDSKIVNYGLGILGTSPRDLDKYFDMPESMLIADAITAGKVVEKMQRDMIESHLSRANRTQLEGYNIPVVNCSSPQIVSELLNIMAEGEPFSAGYYIADDTEYWSLRSKAEGVDVGTLAKKLGGGGHKHASGFKRKV